MNGLEQNLAGPLRFDPGQLGLSCSLAGQFFQMRQFGDPLALSGRETRLHLRREGERRLADAAAAQAPLALSSVMQSVSNLGARLAAPDGVLPI